MRRALFRLQYERVALPMATIALVVFAGLGYTLEFIGRGNGRVADRREIVDNIVAYALAFAAFYAGSAPFLRTFKERHIVFLHTLPLRRWESWLITTGAALAAYVSFVLLTILLRPSLVGHVNVQLDRTRDAWPMVILLVGLMFAAGACGALLAMHPAAMFISTILCGAACFGAAAIGAGRHLVAFPRDEINELAGIVSSLVLPVAIPALLLASALLFAEGEIFVMRRLPRRLGVLALAMALSFVGGDVLARMRFLTEPERHIVTFSQDGSRIAQLNRQGWLRECRVVIHDTRTGKRLVKSSGPYIAVYLLRDGMRIMVRSNGSLARTLLGMPNQLTIERWRDDRMLPGGDSFPDGWFLDYAPPILSTCAYDDTCIVATLLPDGKIRRRIVLPGAHGIYAGRIGSTLFVRPWLGSRLLRIRDDVDELSFASDRETAIVIGDEAQLPRNAMSALSRIAPLAELPAAAGTHRTYLCDDASRPRQVCVADPLDAIAWTEPTRGNVFRFDPRAARWTLVAKDLPVDPRDRDDLPEGIRRRPATMVRLSDDRFVTIQKSGAGSTLRLGDRVLATYPAAENVTVELEDKESVESVEFLKMTAALSDRTQIASELALNLDTGKVLQGPWHPYDPKDYFASTRTAEGERIVFTPSGLVTTGIDGRVLSRVALER